MVEFALVLPMLLILLLGIADFGRVFSAGITMEAATRNGAEAAAQEYLQIARTRAVAPGDYGRLHQLALDEVCREAKVLPNFAAAGGSCSMPTVAVCIHDGQDDCTAAGAGAPAECTAMSGWSNAIAGGASGASGPLPYVEVRACYRFTTLFNLTHLTLPFGWGLTLGDVWIQKDRHFAVADY